MEQDSCSAGKCDIFDFMAHHVGLTVIHPGGLAATAELAKECGLHAGDRILDLGCGKGTSAICFARKYGCSVTGIDLSESLIAEARARARHARVTRQTQFVVGDAQSLPFPDGAFDAVVSQAVLVLVKDKERVIEEAVRVTRPGGRLAWMELTWRKPPTPEFLQAISDVLCAYCMQNVETQAGWQGHFQHAGIANVKSSVMPLPQSSLRTILHDEGCRNAAAVMMRTLFRAEIRARTQRMARFFREHSDTFGYGIYVGTKLPV